MGILSLVVIIFGGVLIAIVVIANRSGAKPSESSTGKVFRLSPQGPANENSAIEDVRREAFSQKASAERDRGPRPADPIDGSTRYRWMIQEELLRQHGECDLDTAKRADVEFEGIVAETVPVEGVKKSFYAKVAGAKHDNSDHSSRTRIIDNCKVFDTFDLKREPENRFDSNAIALLKRETGEMLGYLDAELASEIAPDWEKHGLRWVVMLRHKNYSPETGKVAGATLFVIRLTDAYAAQLEKAAEPAAAN